MYSGENEKMSRGEALKKLGTMPRPFGRSGYNRIDVAKLKSEKG